MGIGPGGMLLVAE